MFNAHARQNDSGSELKCLVFDGGVVRLCVVIHRSLYFVSNMHLHGFQILSSCEEGLFPTKMLCSLLC